MNQYSEIMEEKYVYPFLFHNQYEYNCSQVLLMRFTKSANHHVIHQLKKKMTINKKYGTNFVFLSATKFFKGFMPFD